MSRLHDLIALAREDSSDKRRDLLREITDQFFMRPPTAAEAPLYDSVMSALSAEMEESVRAELGVKFADRADAPVGLIRTLANDEAVTVAGPVLSRSPVLTEEDLLQVVRSRGQGHLRAVSVRPAVPEAVSDVIVRRGDDRTLGVLLGNEGARLSRAASEAAVERAKANPELHEAVVGRRALPADLLNEMYFVVEARLRERILQENAAMDPALLEQALAQGRRKAAEADGLLPSDYEEAVLRVDTMAEVGELDPAGLIKLLREGGSGFTVALARLADIDFHTAQRILASKELDALAIVCRAANLNRAVFLTVAVVLLGDTAGAMGRAREYGELYAALPKDTALRTLRFWRLRRQSPDLAAA